MSSKRSYGEACAAAHALDLVGERWGLLVVRELLFGPKRFTDLRRGMPSASPNVLSQRLRDLERTGVIRRRDLPPPVAASVYELTEWGRDLEGVVLELGRWGVRSPALPGDAPASADSIALGLRVLFDPEPLDGRSAVYQLCLGRDIFRVAVSPEGIEVERGDAGEADAALSTDERTFAELMRDPAGVSGAISGGRLRVEGDAEAAELFFTLFPMPEPVAVAADPSG